MPRLALLIPGGMLAALATGSYSIAVAAWLAPVLLLFVARSGSALTGLLPAALVQGLAFAFAWRGTFGIPAGVFAVLGVLFFLPYLVDRLLAPRLRGFLATLVFPCAWVSFEFALTVLPMVGGQPLGTWGSVAYSQVGVLPLLQVVSVTGIWGVTFLVGWFASLTNWAWNHGSDWAEIRGGVLAFGSLLAAVLIGGGLRLAMAPAADESVRVAGIAVDNPALTVGVWNPVARGRPVTEEDRAGMRTRLETLHDSLFAASLREARAGARIIVWAEDNAIVFKEDEDRLIARGQTLARAEQIHLFMGLVALLPGEPAENKVVAISPDGSVAFSYLKSYPTPWEASRRGDGVLRFVDSGSSRLGAAICYDYDHPGLLRAAGRAGADIMMAPSDDGMHADPLHAHMATLRAIENGFSMVRPVIGGRAIAVDPYGRVLAQADYGPEAYFAGGTHVLVAFLPTRGVATIYAWVGDALAWLSIGFLALASAVAVGRRGGRSSRLVHPRHEAMPGKEARPVDTPGAVPEVAHLRLQVLRRWWAPRAAGTSQIQA
jgi:apolipoprotein N-acyltransferase